MSQVDERVTPGLTKALMKQTHLGVCSCGFPLPKYPGRYPAKCPVCGTPRSAMRKQEEAEEGDGNRSASS